MNASADLETRSILVEASRLRVAGYHAAAAKLEAGVKAKREATSRKRRAAFIARHK